MAVGMVKAGPTRTCLDCGEVRPASAFSHSGLACDDCEAAHKVRQELAKEQPTATSTTVII